MLISSTNLTSTSFLSSAILGLLAPQKLPVDLEVMAQMHVATTGSRSCRCSSCFLTPLIQGHIGGETHEQPSLKTSNTKKTNPLHKMNITPQTDQGESFGAQSKWDIQPPQTNEKGKEPEPRTNSDTTIVSSKKDEQNSTGNTLALQKSLGVLLTNTSNRCREQYVGQLFITGAST